MNRKAEIALFLTRVSVTDKRTVGKADVEVWADALEGVDLGMAVEALTDHVRHRAQEWFTPTHVLSYIRQIHRQRMQDAGPVDYPADLTQAQERTYRLLWLDAVKSGMGRDQATAHTDQALGHTRTAIEGTPRTDREFLAEVKRRSA
jgi:hypothetical protein